MVILALDTTTRAGSVALIRDAAVQDVFIGDPSRSHGERLPGDIGALLNRHALKVADLDLFAIVAGPGSFTGLRVGIAAIQGLAMAADKLVVPVPALEAFAASDRAPDGIVGVWMDAQRQQVFAALYDKRGARMSALAEAVSLPPDAVVAEWTKRGFGPSVLIGDGIELYRERARAGWPSAGLVLPAPPLAPVAGLIAARQPELAVHPHAIVPIYVRRSDAELARDRPAAPPRP